MAFPTTATERAVHYEGKKAFVFEGGKWRVRPSVRVSQGEVVTHASLNLNIDRDDATVRILANASFFMYGDGNVKFNVAKNGTWMNPNSSDFDNCSAALSKGDASWRKGGDWKSVRAPDGGGFWLTWAATGDSWAVGHANPGACEIDIEQIDDTTSVFHWIVIYYKLNDNPAQVIGSGTLKAIPSQISMLAFNAESSFSHASLVAEAY
jgi:hypothetical protein